MGVPKFFRYMSERYPCLSELVKEYQIPEFDNLYLDMNGIIHMCSHPDDNNPHFRITEEKIFKDIFHYIEVLFRMIKPQRTFFMAVDGVAPRAKMNQQRGRRFRSAKDAEKMEAEATKKGEVLPDAERFDSNCITPGTPFMARLQEQLKYFVVDKISNDPLWKKCKVILSGHETPGEGEHKIMDYIRYTRAQPGYDPNTRHCLYGLDADLIMLGLCTHEPHFSLLREEVKFGKKSTKRVSVPEEITFFLLHLSLMREYLELEFMPLKSQLQSFEYDFEKIIDDWVLMGFLVGNDFIPHLPNLHIANGALPILYKAYMDILPTLEGYINESGSLNLERFEKFMQKLGSVDVENFEEIRDDLLYMEAKTGKKWNAHSSVSLKPDNMWKPDEGDLLQFEALEPEKPMDSGLAALIKETDDMCMDSGDEIEDENDEDGAFEMFKKDYYKTKLEYQNVTPEVLRSQAEGYVRAIQWNLNYYYNGCCSWSWYYPHHYAPYISDIKGFKDLKLVFELGKPFHPYEQLLAVLPAASKKFLPECYHKLMTDENSMIKHYYPEDFATDLNGKRQEWEAVVLIPFIDENLLLEAMRPCNLNLTPEEIKRNTQGPMLIYTYTKKDMGKYECPEDLFPVVPHNHAELKTLSIDEVRVPVEKLVKGKYPGVKMDVYYPGFPTMKHLKYEGELKKAKIKVFESPSRNENMIISILRDDKLVGDQIPIDLLGNTVFVSWPHLVEAKVIAISNNKRKYISIEGGYNTEDMTDQLLTIYNMQVKSARDHYMNRLGIDVGKTSVLIHVQVMIGRKYSFTPHGRLTLEKQFAPGESCYPLQSVVFDISSYDSSQGLFKNANDVFPVGCICFTITNPYYGSQGEVLDSVEALKNGRIKIQISVVDEPDFSYVKELHERTNRNYKTLYHAASQLGMPNLLFSRITSGVYITARNNEGGLKNVAAGLELKFKKRNQETPGYTRKINNTWFYTDKAIELVNDYSLKFPEIFHYLSRDANADVIDAEVIFPDDWDVKIKELTAYLKSLPSHSVERRMCGSAILDPEIIEEVEKLIDSTPKNKNPKKVTMQVKAGFLYRPEIQSGTLIPDSNTTVKVFDRVVNVRTGFSVPFGLKGTVVAIHESTDGNERDTMYDVVFDEPFKDGMMLNCSENRGYRLPKNAFINITYGQRLMEERTGKTADVMAKTEAERNGVSQPNGQKPFWGQQTSAFASFNSSGSSPNSSSPSLNSSFNQNNSNSPNFNSGFKQNNSNNFMSRNKDSYDNKEQNSFMSRNRDRDNQQAQQNWRRNSDKYEEKNQKQRDNHQNYQQTSSKFDINQLKKAQPKGNDSEKVQKVDDHVSKILRNPDFMPKFMTAQQETTKVAPNIVQQLQEIQQHQQKQQQQEQQQNPQQKESQHQTVLPTPTLPQMVAPTLNMSQTVDTDMLKKMLKIGEQSEQTKTEPTPSVDTPQNVFKMFAHAAKASPTVQLLTYYQSNQMGCPRYYYIPMGENVACQVTLPNGKNIIGQPCKTKEEASENVASAVLNSFLNKPKEDLPSEPVYSWVQTAPRKESGSKSNLEPPRAGNSFVPLQVMKKRSVKENSTETISEVHTLEEENPIKENQNAIANIKPPGNSNQEPSKNTQKSNKSGRKTRIAANFKK